MSSHRLLVNERTRTAHSADRDPVVDKANHQRVSGFPSAFITTRHRHRSRCSAHCFRLLCHLPTSFIHIPPISITSALHPAPVSPVVIAPHQASRLTLPSESPQIAPSHPAQRCAMRPPSRAPLTVCPDSSVLRSFFSRDLLPHQCRYPVPGLAKR